MNYIDHIIFFPLGRLSSEFVETYLTRYTDPDTGWAAAHWDDTAHTTRRKASLFDGTIAPSPHYTDQEPVGADDEWRAAHLNGHTISAGWPAPFIFDLSRDPQPEPELFNGVTIQ